MAVQIIMGTVFASIPWASIRLRTTAASGVRGLIRPAMAPMSPMMDTIMGSMPADTDKGMAITGIMARQGMEPGPTALRAIPIRNMAAGMAWTGTLLTIFFASSSKVPLPLMMAKRYVTPTI